MVLSAVRQLGERTCSNEASADRARLGIQEADLFEISKLRAVNIAARTGSAMRHHHCEAGRFRHFGSVKETRRGNNALRA